MACRTLSIIFFMCEDLLESLESCALCLEVFEED